MFRLAVEAERDLAQIFANWAKNDGVDVADRLIRGLVNHLQVLHDHPDVARTADDIAPDISSYSAGRFVIYLRRSTRGIDILHVFHGLRNPGQAPRISPN
jgi:plasmid stabilization system protein ParE